MAIQKSKFYAVRSGFIPGIYKNWDACKEQVVGFPGAEFKSFTHVEDAKSFMKAKSENGLIPPDSCVAYIDGSYDAETKRYSCGVVILKDLSVVATFFEVGTDVAAAEMRNIAGEILGSKKAIEYALNNNIQDIIIFHDYLGISKWAEGEWRANNNWTKAYAEFVEKARYRCNISFRKVKGHSGDKYNDMADRLAKNALGIK